MKKDDSIQFKHIDVLDGIRAISVVIVLVFHFWQQTWIFPIIKTPFLKFIGLTQLNFTPIVKVGYLFVDMMILISGFLLFLPVARNVILGEPLEKFGKYFKKRAIRILPSYLFCIILLFVYELATGGFGDPIIWKDALRDLFLHLTFMHTWTVKSYLSTKLDVVLWTLAIEVWFYILFPLFAMFIRRWKKESSPWPGLIRAAALALVFVGVSYAYIYGYALNTGSAFAKTVDGILKSIKSDIRSDYLSMTINQLPAFMGVYAVGLIGSFIYVFAAKYLKRRWWSGLIFTVLSIGFIWLMMLMINDCASLEAEAAQKWQMTERLYLALVYMGFILTAAFSVKPYRFLFSNKLMVFLAGISYNLYIWHQWLAVKLKYDWRIPSWTGTTPPNQLYGADATAWKNKYAIMITVTAFLAAILATYLVERPAADLLNGRPSIYNGKLKKLFKKDVPKSKAQNKKQPLKNSKVQNKKQPNKNKKR